MQKDRLKRGLGIGALIVSIGYFIIMDIIRIFYGNFKSAFSAILSLITIGFLLVIYLKCNKKK